MEIAVPLYRSVPFLRPLLALIAGIIVQYYQALSFRLLVVLSCTLPLLVVILSVLPLAFRFRLRSLSGILQHLSIASLGAILIWSKDIRNSPYFIGRSGKCITFMGTLSEPPVTRTKTLKAVISIKAVVRNGQWKPAEGKLIAYIKTDSLTPALTYGSQIIFNKSIQEITNSGNPGCFDYRSYCFFEGITHQVYLSRADYTIARPATGHGFGVFIQACKTHINRTLTTYIGNAREKGLSEALLIGYKDDLDKRLQQSYTSTGVVHIIAISGGHLAIVYAWLLFLTAPLRRLRHLAWMQACIILAGLWLFTFLTGSQASIVRSAIMFSCIVCAQLLKRQHSIYNALACAAFLSLAWNPFWLWDAGFQLSYAAVLSILLFFKPLYQQLRFQNKIIDNAWKLTAVTLAAQVFTTPLSLYYFHQFPVLFLPANLVAVPLSGIIITGEIFLCLASFVHPVAGLTARCIQYLLTFMNHYIERLEQVSFAVWQGISVSVLQTILLTLAMAAVYYLLVKRQRQSLGILFVSLLIFTSLRVQSFFSATRQQKLVVYNLMHYTAIELIEGRHYSFLGDPQALQDPSALTYTFVPAHTLLRINNQQAVPPNTTSFNFYGQPFLRIDHTTGFKTLASPFRIHTLILSNRPHISIATLAKTFLPRHVVTDATVPEYLVRQWQHECDSLHIRFHNVKAQGAYVLDLK